MSSERVKFYSVNDISIGFHKKRIEELMKRDMDNELIDINDVLEIMNIELFFDNGISFEDWTEEKSSEYRLKIKSYRGQVGKYSSKINSDTISEIYECVDNEYVGDFWKFISKYKVYDRIDEVSFANLMASKKFRLSDVLQEDKLVKKFGEQIKGYFYNNIGAVRIIICHYLEEGNSNYYIPKELSDSDIEELINRYIELDDANMNYLKLIYQAPASFKLTDRTKLKARRKYEEKGEEIAKDGVKLYYGVKISFGPYDEIANVKMNGRDLECEYSDEWVKENLDFPTLLNNFIYLFGFVDMQYRCLNVGQKNSLGIFERYFTVRGKKEYATGTAFNQLQMLASAQMHSYYEQLLKNDIYLDDIIEWFFEDYLKEEFDMTGFHYNKSSKESSYLEKCRTIAGELDSILKQYKLWCEDRSIDHELLEFSSTPVSVNLVPSMISKKYLYATDKAKSIMDIMFSDQSMMGYIEDYHESGENFYDIVVKDQINISALKPYQMPMLEQLIHSKMVGVVNGIIVPQRRKMWLFRELYYNDVVSNSYIKFASKDVEELLNQGLVKLESSLFSKPEMDYYNYLLNNHEFSNSLGIRNRYVHGNQKNDEKQNKSDYFVMLRMMILIVLKINEEACLMDEKSKEMNGVGNS